MIYADSEYAHTEYAEHKDGVMILNITIRNTTIIVCPNPSLASISSTLPPGPYAITIPEAS
jgi:hypothetical protein